MPKLLRRRFSGGGGSGGATRPIAMIHRAADQTPGVGGAYATFDVEDLDTANMVDLATNNDRITCTTAGIYVAMLNLRSDTSNGFTWIHGGAAGTTRLAVAHTGAPASGTAGAWGSVMTRPKQCAAGEFFRVFLEASVLLAGSTGAPDYSSFFSVWRLDA